MTDLTEGLVRCRGRNGLWVGRGGIQVFPTDIMTAFQCVTSSHERCGLPSYSSIQIPTPAKPSSPLPFNFLLPPLILLCMYLYTNTTYSCDIISKIYSGRSHAKISNENHRSTFVRFCKAAHFIINVSSFCNPGNLLSFSA